MEPDYNLNKKIGISLGVIVVVFVALVTFVSNNKSAPVDTAALVSPSGSNNSATIPPVVPPVTSSTRSSNWFGESEDDESSSRTNSATVPVPPPAIQTVTPVDTKKQYTYKNGTYSATGSYMSPGGQDQIAVTLTLVNDIVTDVSVTPYPGDHTSQRYMDRFVSGYKQYVVGQNIASINLTRVSGSSLTPTGFNNALAQIKSKAKA